MKGESGESVKEQSKEVRKKVRKEVRKKGKGNNGRMHK